MEWGIQEVPVKETQETSQTAEPESRVKEKGSCTAKEMNDANSNILSSIGQGMVLCTTFASKVQKATCFVPAKRNPRRSFAENFPLFL